MDQIDFDTEHSLFSAPESSSSEQTATAMSMPTQRRLIRKPLPEIPVGQANRMGGQSLALGASGPGRLNVMSLEASRKRAREAMAEEQRQLDWWPPSGQQAKEQEGHGDEEGGTGRARIGKQYHDHLWRIIQSSLETSSEPSQDLAKAIMDALYNCLDSIATPEALSSLHRSSSFLWRVEALVRTNEELDCSRASKTGVRWPRLGAWRGSISGNAGGMNTDARRRKRDVALQLLGNAFWMAGAGAGDGVGAGVNMGLEEDESQAREPREETFEKVQHKRAPGAAPRLLVKSSTPTVALQVGDSSVAGRSDGSDGAGPAKTSEDATQERPSVLTTRLAMQLKSSENIGRPLPPAPPRSTPVPLEGRMAVCKVCLDFVPETDSWEEDGETGKTGGKKRRRSGTVTLRHGRRQENMSTMSARSDHTIRGPDLEPKSRGMHIVWKPNQFTGSPLFLNPLSSDAEGCEELQGRQEESRVQLIGGTFVVETDGEDEEWESMVRNVLDIALYAASAMMLESALLRDLNFESEEAEEAGEDGEELGEDAGQTDESASVQLPVSSASDAGSERQSRWPTSIWGLIHHSVPEQTSSVAKRQSHGFPKSKTMDAVTRRVEKRTGGYSGKLGRMLTSFTGAGAKRPSTADQAKVTEDAGKEVAEEREEEAVEGKKDEGEPPKPPPSSISPHDSRRGEGDYERGDYLEHLLSRQSLSLTVLEGLDVSLPSGKQHDQAGAGGDRKRTPLQTRPSYNSDVESKASGSTLSVSRSVATKSARSTSASSQAESTAPSKGSVLSSSADPGPRQSWDERNRREVQFYQRAGTSRDVSLGQAVEEMAAKAMAMDKGARKQRDGKESRGAEAKGAEAKEAEAKGAEAKTHRVAQYLHGSDRISVLASVHPSTMASDQGDVQAAGKASQMGQDLVRSAILLAEQGHQTQESDREARQTERGAIWLWSANMTTGEESEGVRMSDGTYLCSFGAFLASILSHAKIVNAKYEVVRMFRMDNVTLKFQVQPIVVFDLLIDGPVIVAAGEGEGGRAKGSGCSSGSGGRDGKTLEQTRLEIQGFYSSLKRLITALEHIFVARELDEKGNTVKAASVLSSLASLSAMSDADSASSPTDSLLSSLSAGGPLELLSGLKASLRKAEFGLYDLLKVTNASCVNDVRIRFYERASSAKNRLSAWEEKHLSKREMERLEPVSFLEPDYFQQGKHAFPGSRHLIREEEPLSIIAYTLSSKEYKEEMQQSEERHADVLDWRTSVVAPSTNSQLSASNASTTTVSTAGSNATGSTATLDPDLDEEYHVPEPLCVNMKRKRRVKDAGILSLTLKRVSSNISSRSSTVDNESEKGEEKSAAGHTAEGSNEDMTTPTVSRIAASKFDTVSSSSNDLFRAQIAHVSPRSSLGSMFEANSSAPQTPIEERDQASLSRASTGGEEARTERMSGNEGQSATTPLPNAFPRRVPFAPLSPHIKQSITSGSVKISCISWFGQEFAKLRRKWNVEDDFIESMARCRSWNIMGGKSKSGFYITHDGKWIAKQLLNVWSVDEKEAFLEFAPAYLRYMMNSASNDCPTLLVKIAGVYTVKIKDVKTGETKLKMSVQVLENVFAGDEGKSIRFDIKGIRERRVPVKKEHVEEEDRAPVWWDGEWLDCFQARAYVPEDDKFLFSRALNNDLAFLTASNVMDYSLLIGAHDEHDKESSGKSSSFRVRLVDYLGEFTLVKQLESSGKKAIKSQAPTIIPPREYALRFGATVETYFIPCPP